MNTVPRSTSPSLYVALLALLLGFYGAFKSRDEGSSGARPVSTLDTVKKTGTLKAAYVPYPPFVSVNPLTKKPSGFFIDLMEEIAKEGGFEVEYEEASLSTMIAGLKTRKYDTVVSAIFCSLPRAREVEFTNPVLYVGMSAITRADDDRVKSVEDLKKPGLRFAVLLGGSGRQYVVDNIPDAPMTQVEGTDLTKSMLEVLSGRADVALAESVSCSRFAEEHPEARNVFADNPYAVYGTCLVVRQDDDDWRHFLNVAIDRLALNGAIDRFNSKYKERFSESSWYLRARPWRVEQP